METNKHTTSVAGILIIAGMIAGGFSVVPAVEQSDYLILASTQENQVFIGAFFQFLMIPAYIGFALYLYPALKLENEALGMGFVGFRLIAGMFHFIGVVLLPLFIILSHAFVTAGTPDASYFQVLGELLRMGRDLVNHVALILAMSIADLLMFFILYQSRYIPRWLSLWGGFGIGLTILASFMVLFRLVAVVTPFYLLMNVPLALNSIVFAIWLIAKGFDLSKSRRLQENVALDGLSTSL